MNFQVRLDGTSRLAVTTDPVPPIPSSLRAWVETTEDVSVAGRLLE